MRTRSVPVRAVPVRFAPVPARAGATLLELLVVLAVAAVVASLLPPRLAPRGALAAAGDLAGRLGAARAGALGAGRAVAVRWLPHERAFALVEGSDAPAACAAPVPPGAPRLVLPRGVALLEPPRDDLAWRSDGAPRGCRGGLGNRTLRLAGGGDEAAVIVAAAGRIRVEAR